MPSSELFWAGQEVYLIEVFLPVIIGVLIFSTLLIGLFAFGFLRRYRLWRLGRDEKRSDHLGTRLKTALAVSLAHIRLLRESYPGIMHFLILWGSVLLILGKAVRLFVYPVGLTIPPQSVFLYASLASEIGGVMIIVGGCLAVYRRYIVKPSRLDTVPEDTLIFGWVFLLILTGFMIKGYRIAISEVPPADWALWSPVGYLLSHVFPTFMTEAKNEILVWHRVLIHAISAFLFLGFILVSRSRLQHILLSPLNVFFRSLQPKGMLTTIDFTATKTFGAAKIEDFTWKQLLDLDACTRCGRCQDNCPAHLSGKVLSPKKVIQDLKAHLYEVYPIPLATKPVESRQNMVTEVVTEEANWDCTTCYACQESCPVYVEHVDKIIDMRRSRVLTGAKLPEAVQATLHNLEIRGNPWRGTEYLRDDWAKGLEINKLSENSEVELLYWVGCTGALVERNMKVSTAMASILKAAGVNFGILGIEETCCGDPARRMGHELQFQMMAQQNIEIMKRYGVKKIVTHCPHCFHTLKNEYPRFGGEYEVFHHTEFVQRLIQEERIHLSKGMSSVVTYHDSCYLGRYNNIYETPRKLLQAIPKLRLEEMEQVRSGSFCCGAGGGHLWMDETSGKRISHLRLEQAMRTRAETVAVACPYCLQMLEDAVRSLESPLQVRDLIELVADSVT